MNERDFVAAFQAAAKAYHKGDNTSEMDKLAAGCTDGQWDMVRYASDRDWKPTLTETRRAFATVTP